MLLLVSWKRVDNMPQERVIIRKTNPMKALLTHSYTKYVAIILGAVLSVGIVTMAVGAQTTGAQYVQEGSAIGFVDHTQTLGPVGEFPPRFLVRGWAFDSGHQDAGSAQVRVLDGNGEVVETVVTTLPRQDVVNAYNGPLNTGFAWFAPQRYNNGNTHTFTFWFNTADNNNTWQYIGEAVMPPQDAGMAGSLDGVVNNAVIGWAVDLDDRQLHTSQIPVAVYVDGDFIASDVARLQRPDVEEALKDTYHQIGQFHGYNVAISSSGLPAELKDDRLHRVEVFALEVTEGVMTSVGVDWYYISQDGLLYQLIAEDIMQ